MGYSDSRINYGMLPFVCTCINLVTNDKFGIWEMEAFLLRSQFCIMIIIHFLILYLYLLSLSLSCSHVLFIGWDLTVSVSDRYRYIIIIIMIL
jgi:hypothetical protein